MAKKVHETAGVDRLLRLKQVLSIIGLCRTTLYSKIHRGEFPAPVSLGARAVGWPSSAIQEWVKSRVASSKIKGGN